MNKTIILAYLNDNDSNMITIHNFQAGYGDTFLVQVREAENEPINILLDCGYEFREKALKVIEKECSGKLNLMVITHFDDDHIFSAQSFIERYRTELKRTIEIDQIWLNTFRHLPFASEIPDESKKTDELKTEGYILEYSALSENPEEGEIGSKKATNLGAEILKAGIKWNSDFDGKGVCIEHRREIPITDKVSLSLLGPNQMDLEAVKSKFIRSLNEMGIATTKDKLIDDAFEVYNIWLEKEQSKAEEGEIAAESGTMSIDKVKNLFNEYNYEPDDAVGNGSSIVFILNAEKKRVLFLADAHAEDMVTALEEKFKDDKVRPIFFDAIKVAHHGSFKNNSAALHKLIDSDVYIFSTNGRHPSHVHPDVETIAQIINRSLPSGKEKRTLFFNHKLSHLSFLDAPNYQKEFHFKVSYEQKTEL